MHMKWKIAANELKKEVKYNIIKQHKVMNKRSGIRDRKYSKAHHSRLNEMWMLIGTDSRHGEKQGNHMSIAAATTFKQL